MEQSIYEWLTSFFIGIFFGGIIALVYQFIFRKKQERILDKETQRILHKAQSEAHQLERKAKTRAKDQLLKMKIEAEREINNEKKKLKIESEKLQRKQISQEEELRLQLDSLKSQKENLKSQKEELEGKTERLSALSEQKREQIARLTRRLENTAQMTKQEAEVELKKNLEEELRVQLAPKMKEIEERLASESEIKSKNILASALARYASNVTLERTTDSLPVSGDDVKGKIIGREGRNIRALEHTCGVDILIEEGQDAITISCFDPLRRETAKKAIAQLIKDGRVHPARIEEVVEKVKSEIFRNMKEDGERACFDLSIHDVHPEIIKALGSLKYKIVDGQNVMKTSMDLAFLAGHAMAEIGGNEKKAKRAALFHALGLTVDHKMEGHYAQAGADFAKKFGEKADITQAILCHNSKIKAQSVLDHIIQSVFNLHQSLPRPKKLNIESFIRRMKNIESTANSFSGVIRSFAIRAGKEIRVLVDSSQVTDDQVEMLCADISRKIERELDQSHQIKVSVIRESRIIEHAR